MLLQDYLRQNAVDEIFIEVPLFQETYPALKNFWLGPWKCWFQKACLSCLEWVVSKEFRKESIVYAELILPFQCFLSTDHAFFVF